MSTMAATAKKAHIGRNDPCPCGSGRKFKQCCEAKQHAPTPARRLLVWGALAIFLTALAFAINAAINDTHEGSATGRVWSAEHGHWH
jgi:hypothetical protein